MPITLPPSPRILVVVLRRLGDVLLTTPLIRSLKHAWPDARVDVLVHAETAGILRDNPDVDEIVTMPSRPGILQSLALAAQLWRRYALAISAQTGDRPTFFTIVAGRVRVAPVERRLSGRIKSLVLNYTVPAVQHMHRVRQLLMLAEAIGVAPAAKVVPPEPRAAGWIPNKPYAVVHAMPMFRYKQWTADGWQELAGALSQRGLQVIATGGPSERERRYLDAIWGRENSAVLRVDGKLDWPELTALIAEAEVYVGLDTSVTHLAAATGCATVALYGPTDPVLWGPWPQQGLQPAWSKSAAMQRRGNVRLIQRPLPCTPCQLEGCERRLDSYSRCLDELTLQSVLAVVDEALAERASRGGASSRRPV
jgi:heptosyltransferase-3